MFGRLGDRRWRRLAFIGVSLHLVFLMTAQFEHHDLLCHLKTPFHCTSCSSSQLSPSPTTPFTASAWNLSDAGRAVALLLDPVSSALPVTSPGRSPPSLAS